MYIDLLKTYIIKNLLIKQKLKNEDMVSLIEELIKRDTIFKSIYNFKISNLHDILKITLKDIDKVFDFENITLNQEMYHRFLTYIMIDNYSEDENEFILFLNKLIENKEDFYTKEKSKDLLGYIENKEESKLGIYQKINRISSLRKSNLIESFYVLPIYEPSDRIKIVKQIESKGYIDELETFDKPYIQVYLNLSDIISKSGNISKNIYIVNKCYDELHDYTKKEIGSLLENKTLKNFLKSKIKTEESLDLFDRAWEFSINYEEFAKNLLKKESESIKEALFRFMSNNKEKTFKEVFKKHVDIEDIKYCYFDLELEENSLNISERENVIKKTIHPYKNILELINKNYKYQDICEDAYLDFIKDIEIDSQSLIEGRNDLSNQQLIQETVFVKYSLGELTPLEINNYLKIMSHEELKKENYLFSNSEGLLANIDYNNIEDLLMLDKIYPLLEMTDDKKVEMIIENYKKQNESEYEVLLKLLTTNKNIVELLLNVSK